MNMEIMERIVPEAIREAERLNSPWLSVFKIFGDERKVYGAGIILLEALSSADSATKISAAFFLGVCPYWTAWSKLSELLSDLDPRVRRAAIFALGQIGSTPQIVENLRNTMLHDPDPLVREEAQMTLEYINGRGFLEKL